MKHNNDSTNSCLRSRQEFVSEEEYVRWYVLERELTRPPYALLHFVLLLTAFTVCSVALVMAGKHIGMNGWEWPAAIVFALAFFTRALLIAAVKVYQRYVPDSIRRNCILMPTCSEYCILALKKYGVIRGCHKTLHRLFHTCIGDDYREDWP